MKLCAFSANRGAELLPLVIAIPAIDNIGIFAAHLALAHDCTSKSQFLRAQKTQTFIQ